MKYKSAAVLVLLLGIIFAAAARASVLGEVSDEQSTDMGAYTVFHHTSFLSDSVGEQSENYVEYYPNSEAKPVVVNGSSIWGSRTISSAVSYLEDLGIRPMVGVNGDYFSWTTGISMGSAIIDGELVTDENQGQDAVAFKSDGSAFIDWFDIKTTLSDGEKSVDVDCINKWYQNGYDPIFMFTDKFGGQTHTESECYFAICTPADGKLAVGKTLNMTVDEVFVYEGDIAIPDGKVVFAISTGGIAESVEFIAGLAPGRAISVTNNSSDGNDEKWADVTELISSVGGRLISNGEVQDVSDSQAAPRTAVGVKPDGSFILYTLDGRQSGYSYGAQITTIAKRLAELGCTDAINLDGGGSTIIGATFPGTDVFQIVNSPSDGEPRAVANYLFIQDLRERTDIPWIINLSAENNENHSWLSGTSTTLKVDSVYDTSNYRIENPEAAYTIETDTDTTVDDSGNIDFSGSGTASVTVTSGSAAVTEEYNVYQNPDEIRVYNEDDLREITSISTEANEELQLNLTAGAFADGTRLNADDGLFEWSVEGDIGTITSDGIFTLADGENLTGRIVVACGTAVKEIPVTIAKYPVFNPFADTAGHWAEDIISDMYAHGVIKGSESGGSLYFYPDNNMTRAEFASMIYNFMGTDAAIYADAASAFADCSDIPAWAVDCVSAMYAEGIISGRTNADGTISFCPEDKITRAEAMTIIGRITNEPNVTAELSFADNADIPAWAEDGIKKLLALNVVSGYEDNTILPNNNVKRAEAVTMLSKLTNTVNAVN